MVRILAATIVSFTLAGCTRVSSSGDSSAAPAVTVSYDTLEYRSGLLLSGGAPFTGVANATHPDGKPAKEIQLREGRFHGVVKEWAENGTLIVETHFDDGKRHGKNTYWFPDGRLQKEQVYDHDTVVEEKKYY